MKIEIVELYKHEDNLNWTKLNSLIISTIALATGIGFLLEKVIKSQPSFQKFAIYMFFLLGGIVITSFALSIRSGLANMKYWKEIIINHERGKVNECSCDCKCCIQKVEVLQNQTTKYILRIVPWLILGIWLCGFCSFFQHYC